MDIGMLRWLINFLTAKSTCAGVNFVVPFSSVTLYASIKRKHFLAGRAAPTKMRRKYAVDKECARLAYTKRARRFQNVVCHSNFMRNKLRQYVIKLKSGCINRFLLSRSLDLCIYFPNPGQNGRRVPNLQNLMRSLRINSRYPCRVKSISTGSVKLR